MAYFPHLEDVVCSYVAAMAEAEGDEFIPWEQAKTELAALETAEEMGERGR